MNIDERLEALKQRLELLATLHKDTEHQIKRLGKYVRAVSQMILDHEARLRLVEGGENGEEPERA